MRTPMRPSPANPIRFCMARSLFRRSPEGQLGRRSASMRRMKTALFVGLVVVGVVYLWALWQATVRARAARAQGEASAHPSPAGVRHRLRHQLLRHPRHRLLRPDHRDPEVQGAGGRRADPRHPQRGPHPAHHRAGPHLHRHRRGRRAHPHPHDRRLGARLVAGGGVVSGWPRRYVQIGMGCALLVAATLFLLTIFNVDGARAGTPWPSPAASSPRASSATSFWAHSWKWEWASTVPA